MAQPLIEDMREILITEPQNEASCLLAVLEKVQSRYGYLPRQLLILVSQRLNVPLSQVYSLATFYNAFSLTPQGRHRIQICTGTACHVRGAMQVLDRLETQLGLRAGQTSADHEFTLETVNCLGACALGPIVVADGGYEGQMTASRVDRLLKRIPLENET